MDQLDAAKARLDRALQQLEGVMEAVIERAAEPALLRRERDALVTDRDALSQRLEASMAREVELQGLADEASAALGAAIEEVRAALERDG